MEQLKIRNNNGDVDHNDFECDDIKGVHGCDIQHNLNPTNDNDHVNQIDDGDDSSCKDSKEEDKDFDEENCEEENCTDEEHKFNNAVETIRSNNTENDTENDKKKRESFTR